ncbi:MAG: DUF6702 family protein [Bacteroidota bacterium]
MQLAILLFSFLLHPFHVSVTDVKYKADQKSLQISSRIFLDDLELALRETSGDQSLDITDPDDWEQVKTELKQYVLERISLEDQKGKVFTLKYVGAEIEEDVMWCYMEIEKVKRLSLIKVTNSILHEIWADQENLVHFRAFDTVKSGRLQRGSPSKKFDWEGISD